VDGADLSGVVGTPTLFVDGRRYQGQLDRQDLVEMVQVQQLRQLSTR
jgi:protein-disulfide isomerase